MSDSVQRPLAVTTSYVRGEDVGALQRAINRRLDGSAQPLIILSESQSESAGFVEKQHCDQPSHLFRAVARLRLISAAVLLRPR